MKKIKTYYETTRNGLVLSEFVGYKKSELTSVYNVVLKVLKTKAGYTKGELIETSAHHFVTKAKRSGVFEMVKSAPLPALTVENTLS